MLAMMNWTEVNLPGESRRVVGERLHEPVELGAEAALAEVGGGVDEVALTLPPLCPPILEPNLNILYI